jgi:hypothetical protein
MFSNELDTWIRLEGVLVSVKLSSLGSSLCERGESRFKFGGWGTRRYLRVGAKFVGSVAWYCAQGAALACWTRADESSLGQRHRDTRIFYFKRGTNGRAARGLLECTCGFSFAETEGGLGEEERRGTYEETHMASVHGAPLDSFKRSQANTISWLAKLLRDRPPFTLSFQR